jgi:hypothetical protein
MLASQTLHGRRAKYDAPATHPIRHLKRGDIRPLGNGVHFGDAARERARAFNVTTQSPAPASWQWIRSAIIPMVLRYDHSLSTERGARGARVANDSRRNSHGGTSGTPKDRGTGQRARALIDLTPLNSGTGRFCRPHAEEVCFQP